MKRFTSLPFAVLIAFAAKAAEPPAVPPKAIKVARDFVALLHNEKPDSVRVTPLRAEGTFAEVEAAIPGKVCNVKLQVNATANPDGWVVYLHSCSPVVAK